MKCTNCGFEDSTNPAFCANCGSPAAPPQYAQSQGVPVPPYVNAPLENPVTQTITQMFKDSLFLILCIAMSLSVGITVAYNISNSLISFPIFDLLITVFLWIGYVQCQNNTIDVKNIRYVSGTIFGSYVCNWILFGLIGFVGILFTVLFSTLQGSDFWDTVISQVESYPGFDALGSGLTEIFASFAVVLGLIIILVAVVGVLVNIFAIRSMHKFVQSLYRSGEQGQFYLVKADAAKSWIMVFGVFIGISAVFNLFGGDVISFLSNGCKAAALIISVMLINKLLKSINIPAAPIY